MNHTIILSIFRKSLLLVGFLFFSAMLVSAQNEFVVRYKTNNPGKTGSTRITIQTHPDYDYNFDIDINNDGSWETTGITANHWVTSNSEGYITIAFRGEFPAIYSNADIDAAKLVEIKQWGDNQWQTMERAFKGCTDLVISATDTPDLSNVSSMREMFDGATSLNYSFEDWDISGITNMSNMLNNTSFSQENYDKTLIGWAAQDVQIFNDMGMVPASYCHSSLDREKLIMNKGWKIFDEGENCSDQVFITTWKTDNSGTSNSTSITIPTNSAYTYYYNVDWNNDGVYEQRNVTGSVTHDYGTAGTKTIRIQGTFPSIYFNDGGDKEKLLSVDQWGSIQWETMDGAFKGCSNLSIAATDAPDLSNVTSLKKMFNFSGITTEDLSSWNVSTIENFQGIFLETAFNGNVSTWDVSSATNMKEVFRGCYLFNQDISAWDVSNATSMLYMFLNATEFDKDISGWNVSNVGSMGGMFSGALKFNRDISAWNVSKVTNMDGMFYKAIKFNQDISAWDVSNVTDMKQMFQNASTFNQNLDIWNITAVDNMLNMFYNTALSAENYDAILNGWATQSVNSGIDLGTVPTTYCEGYTGKDILTNTKAWTINDLGKDCDEETHFVTTWKTDNAGVSNSTSITIPTNSAYTYSYNVDWNNDGVYDEYGITGNVTHDFGTAGTYTIRIGGTFPAIKFDWDGDYEKLLSVDQWGTTQWQTMEYAFAGCVNMSLTATDVPDLSQLTSLSSMFNETAIINNDLTSWNVSTVTDFSAMFAATSFTGDISNWSTANALNMNSMFTSSSFNGDLSNWDVSNVTDMGYMFSGATSFTGDITGWNVAKVTNMSGMFRNNTSFNQNIGTWNVGKVTNMNNMFAGAIGFNQDISSWNVSQVKTMNGMFMDNTVFNQNISNWATDSLKSMYLMFSGATAFDQNLGGWNVTGIVAAPNMSNMFQNSGISPDNYDLTLQGWATQNVASGIILGAVPATYCNGAAARNTLITTYNWSISDSSQLCPETDYFITTWKTDNGSSAPTSITIPTYGDYTYNYHVDWDNDGVYDEFNITGNVAHDYGTAGTYTVRIGGTFPCITFQTASKDRPKIISVDQWGTNKWETMVGAFMACDNISITASDAPDLSNATSIRGAFYFSGITDDDLSNWDVSTITDFSYLFEGSTANCNISTWDVSNATNMDFMFKEAPYFNCDISQWDVSKVTNMEDIFYKASAFNQNISKWDIRKVTDMSYMFAYASSFNQDISGWDVSHVKDMSFMFKDASKFNQDLSTWDISNAYGLMCMLEGTGFNHNIGNWDISGLTDKWDLYNIFNNTNLSAENYDAILQGWAAQTVGIHIELGTVPATYCEGASARNTLVNNYAWKITDNGQACPETNFFVTTWKTDNSGASDSTSISIPTNPAYNYSYNVDWDNDGVFDEFGISGNVTHAYDSVGEYTIRIWGDFPAIMFDWDGDYEKIISVDQWGTIPWQTMEYAFGGCVNMSLNATDVPDLSQVTSLSSMFNETAISNNDLTAWDVSHVTDFSAMFAFTGFTGDISNWNTVNAANMNSMFANSSANVDISNWNVSNVKDMGYMFAADTSFTSDITGWDVSNVTNMASLFVNNTSFNQKIGNWNVGKVTDMSNMFKGATGFNQDISTWDVSGVVSMNAMFSDNTVFNQDISNWNTSSLTSMYLMFSGATAFDQNIGGWNVTGIMGQSMSNMFQNSGISTANYDATLQGWAAQSVKSDINLGTVPVSYCSAYDARNTLINTYNWTINDLGRSCSEEAHFVTSWNTTISGGMLSNTEIYIATHLDYEYNFDVDWNNDGVFDEFGLTEGIVHDYGTAGTYSVRIQGKFPAIYFGAHPDYHKLISVEQWGSNAWETMENALHTCANVKVRATDIPDLSQVTSIAFMFAGIDSIEQDISDWDVSNVSNMKGLFSATGSFNQNLSDWDISKVENMEGMYYGTSLSQANYDATLIGWAAQNVKEGINLGTVPATYCNGEAARDTLINTYGWSISDNGKSCSESNYFVTTWKTDNAGSSGNTEIVIPTNSSYTYNYNVDWDNDGIFDEFGLTGNATHDYGTPGTYTIRIQGGFPAIRMYGSGEVQKLISIDQWGSNFWETMEFAFAYCSKLTINATDAPKLSNKPSLQGAFTRANLDNADFTAWDVSNISNFFMMFESATGNWDVSTWDVSSATNMQEMFKNTTEFNNDISGWNVSDATNLSEMFSGAASFNQNLANWNITNVSSASGLNNIFLKSGITQSTYDNILNGWATQNVASGINLGTVPTTFCDGASGHNTLVNTYGWTISDYGKGCDEDFFITTWKTDNSGSSGSTEITIPVNSAFAYNYNVDWDNDGIIDETGLTGEVTHNFGTAGTYTIRISGTFPAIYFEYAGDDKKLISVDQWGTTAWQAMEAAFSGCNNLIIVAEDVPDLSAITNLEYMFEDTYLGTSDLSNWDVSTITNFYAMFIESSFNGNISTWNMENATRTAGMFTDAVYFNQDISSWDVSNVVNMSNMFENAAAFNQDISTWNISKVATMNHLFAKAAAFNQNLSSWDITGLTDENDMYNMFANTALTPENYDSILIGWASQDVGPGIKLGTVPANYCAGSDARTYLTSTKGWSITDDGCSCPEITHFVTTWKTDNPGSSGDTQITIPTNSSLAYNYDVDWDNDGVFDTLGVSGDITHDYGSAGTYTVRIQGTFPAIKFNSGGDKEKLLSVDRWGTQVWQSMAFAFSGCKNLLINAGDSPDLSNVTTLEFMFTNAELGEVDLSSWDVSTISNFTGMFRSSNFNGNISTWDMSKAEYLSGMFTLNTAFNGDISSWDVSNVSYMPQMFYGASSFNGNIENWNTGSVISMREMFRNSTSFNRNLGDWDIANVSGSNIFRMFMNCGLTTANYDSILIAWAAQDVKSGINLGSVPTTYCAGAEARELLTSTKGWTINDQGLETDAPLPNVPVLSDIYATEEVASLTAPTADDCVGTITGISDVTLPITTLGTTVVTWTYDDGHGNTSIQTQNVIISCPTNTEVDIIEACGSYTWIDGVTYTESNNTATYTLTNAAGCDSIVTLDLTINNSVVGDTNVIACESFEWYGTVYIESGTPTHTFTSSTGCDSVVTLNLTITEPTSGTDVIEVCGSYTWIDGVIYTESNNTATFTKTNSVGCDSVVTLDLTINYPSTIDTSIITCSEFEYHGTIYDISGIYSTTLVSHTGCDSIVNINLTILEKTFSYDTITACGEYEWHGETFNLSGDYEKIFTNSVGCDSIAMLNLTISDSDSCTTTSVYNYVQEKLKVYPNPASDYIYIELPGDEILNIALVDMVGRIVITKSLKGKIEKINVSSIPEGTYILKVINSELPTSNIIFIK